MVAVPFRAPTQRLVLAFACLALLSGCGEEGLFPTTVDPGPDYSIADLIFDEGFYYCQIERRVIVPNHCGAGDPAAGDTNGGCHFSVTAFRLTDYAPPVYESCDGNVPGSAIPAAARQNYQTSQARMRRDADVAPFLQRPLKKLTHPRAIFNDNSDAAAAIKEWANQVSTQ